MFLVSLCLPTPPAFCNGIPDVSWTPLLENRPLEAVDQLADAIEELDENRNHDWGLAQNGLALAGWTVGDYETAAQAWLNLTRWAVEERGVQSSLRQPEFLEAYLYCLLRCTGSVRIDDSVRPVCSRLASTAANLEKKRLLSEMLLVLSNQAMDVAAMKHHGENLGLLTHWDAVVGPFGHYGAMDFEKRFGPELDPAKAEYDGMFGPVRWRSLPADPPTGQLALMSLLHPARGVGYARAVVFSPEKTVGVLTVDSRVSLRLWWNGRMIISRDRDNLDLEERTTVPVNLRVGENYLLLKLRRQWDDWTARAFIRAPDLDEPLESRDVSAGWFVACHPSQERFPARRTAFALEEFAARRVDNQPDQVDRLAYLYSAGINLQVGRFRRAHRYLEELEEAYPDWALIHVLLGEAASKEAAARPGKSTRLENLARREFETARALCDLAAPAVIGLGEYFRQRQTYDQALEILEEGPKTIRELVKTERSGQWVLHRKVPPRLSYALGRVYEDLEYGIEARVSYRTATVNSVGGADAWTRLSSLLEAKGATSDAFAVAQEGSDLFPMDGSLILRMVAAASKADREGEALANLDRWLEVYPDNFSARSAKAGALESLGRHDLALREYAALRRILPNNPVGYVRAGDLLLRNADVTAGGSSGQLREALGLLRDGLRYRPQSVDLRRRIHKTEQALLAIQQKTSSQQDKPLPDEKYDIDVLHMDRSDLDQLPQEKAASVYILDLMVVTIHLNGTHASLIHQAVLLKNKEGRDAFADISVPRQAEILLARTILADGTVYEAETITDTGHDQSVSMYGLEDDCIVDYAYRLTQPSIPQPGRDYIRLAYHFGAVNDPMLLSELVVLAPKGRGFIARSHPLGFQPETTDDSDWRVSRWTKRLSPGVKSESHAPPMSLRVPTVKITTCPDWDVGMERGRSYFKGTVEGRDRINEVASLLGFDVEETRAKVQAAYSYVQKNIEPGGDGLTILDTLENRSGSVLDRTLLCRALLDSMGVGSVVGFTYDSGEDKRFPPRPTASYLADTVLLVPADQGPQPAAFDHPDNLWLSVESRYAPLGEIRDSVLDKAVFLYGPHGLRVTRPPAGTAAGGWIERQLAFDLSSSEESTCRGRFFYHGDLRSTLRKAIVDETTRQRIVSAEVGRIVRGIRMTNGAFEGVEDLITNLAIRFEGRVSRVLQPSGDGFTLDPILDRSQLASAAREPEREQPVKFDEPVACNPYQAGFRLASGTEEWIYSQIPEDVVLISRFGYFSLDYELRGDTLWVTRSAYVPAQWIEPEDYAEFQEFCREADTAEARLVRVNRWAGVGPPKL